MQTTQEFTINGRHAIFDIGHSDVSGWFVAERVNGEWVRIIEGKPTSEEAAAALRALIAERRS